MAKKPLRVAVIGIGVAGRFHCETVLKHVPDMKLVAVVENARDRGQAAAAEYGVPWLPSHEALIARRNFCDVVTIASPHPCHAGPAVACARAGLHVLVEKPLAESVGEADRMIRAARRHHIVLGCILQRRFAPEVRKAIAIVEAGKLGALVRAELIFTDFRTQAYYEAGAWRATWKGEGGGVLLNQAPHYLDLFVRLAGLPSRVLGRTRTAHHRIEVEDEADALLRYDNGATGYLYASTIEPYADTRIEVVGDRGRLTLRDHSVEWVRFGPRSLPELIAGSTSTWDRPTVKPHPLPVANRPTTHKEVFRNFARHILHREPLLCSGESALASLELANAVSLSSWQRRELELPVSRTDYARELARRQARSTARKMAPQPAAPQVDPRMRGKR